jgi:integrase/recombinase XerD
MPETSLIVVPQGISPRTRLAAAGYLARYSGLTLKTYATSLEIYFRWLAQYGVDPLEARRGQIELFMKHLQEERHCAPSSVHHHIGPIRGFYRFAVIDDLISKNPSLDLHLPKIWIDPWRKDWLTGAEMSALVEAANRSAHPSDQGLIALLALLGFRITEALAVQIEDYRDTIEGRPVIHLIGKGGKPATLPITAVIIRMLDAAAGDRTSGPLLLRETSSVRAYVGTPLTYKAARVALDRLAREVGIERRIAPHMARRGFVTKGLDEGISIRDMQIAARHEDPRTTARYDRGAQNLDGSAIHKLSAVIAGPA